MSDQNAADNNVRLGFMGIGEDTRAYLSEFWKIVEPQLLSPRWSAAKPHASRKPKPRIGSVFSRGASMTLILMGSKLLASFTTKSALSRAGILAATILC